MAEFTPIATQEEFDALIKDRIDRAKESVRKEFADYETVKSDIVARDAEIAKLKEEAAANKTQLDNLASKLSASETASAKTRICAEYGLPFDLCGRLNGTTEEEIRKDAETLVSLFGKTQKTPPLYSADGNNQKPMESALRALSEALKR